MVECDDQAAQRYVSDRLVPVVNDRRERLFALQHCQYCAQDGGHQEQKHQDLVKPDAAERRENEEDDDP